MYWKLLNYWRVNINYTGKVIHLMKIYFQVLQKIVVK